MQNLAEAVRAYSYDHYDEDGWDYVAETMTDEDIIEEIGDKVRTPEGAIRKIRILALLWNEQRLAVMNE